MQPFCFQRRLLLSPQVFQQACRHNSITSQLFRRVLPKVQKKPEVEKTRKPPASQGSSAARDDDEEIRWFEKDVDSGDIKRVAANPEDMEATEVRKQLAAMTARMRQYDASIDSKEYHETVIAAFPEDKRKEVSKALADERARRRQQERSLQIRSPSQQVAEPVLKQLQTQLRRAAEGSQPEKTRVDLWKSFQAAKRAVAGLNARIPAEAWHVLWRSAAEPGPANIHREERLLELAKGMGDAGVVLLPEEAEAKYEAMVMQGQSEEAILQWKREYKVTDGKSRSNLEHGIKLYAAVGDIRKGFRVARQYLQEIPQANARALHPLIHASIETGNDHMAYTLYLLLRDRLGSSMEMRDYDLVVARFLTDNKKDLALAVFRDMMLQGTKAVEKQRITVEEEKKMKEGVMRRLDALHGQSITSQEINDVSLRALADLPTRWQNKFFFGSWIKKLIGMSDLTGAMKVVELMYQRGLTPDATHVNGIIGGLMRSKDAEYERRGQAIGWAMIYRRVAYIASRTGRDLHMLQDFGQVPAENALVPHQVPLDLSRPVPQANIETFNVLGLHYLLTSQWSHLRHLRRMLKPGEIRMGSFFMNHLLYMQLYNNGPSAIWNDFAHHTKTTAPDMESFNALWHAQQEVTNPLKRVERDTFPVPRTLFKVMLDWRATVPERLATRAVESFSAEIYARIVTVFCNEKDFPALVVAMQAILKHFGVAPDAEVAGVIVTGLGNVYQAETATVRGRKGRIQMRRREGKADAVEKVLEALRERRVQALERDGVVLEDMDEKAQKEENVGLLVALVKSILGRIQGDDAAVEEAVDVAAKEMGLGSSERLQ
ncbi:hypothetical protein KVT40_008262 [Elsinoe batatas]|uniref:Pentatricopeptide repeat protein n=1 Tax=Elsinoe batatas TaxID=2601811 RepID=A0A8K0KWJ3_9PEZI|nr:hypothetical protein KVT40_008262 [Elsinoe batatas]